jgi:hypothetical protein
VQPRFIDVVVPDPIAYVLSLNLKRRHLTPSQRSMVGARVRELYDRQAKERQKQGGERGRRKQHGLPVTTPEAKGEAREIAGKSVGVGGSTIDRATKVLKKGVPEFIQAVDEGRLPIYPTAKLVDQPPGVQRAINGATVEDLAPARAARGGPAPSGSGRRPTP